MNNDEATKTIGGGRIMLALTTTTTTTTMEMMIKVQWTMGRY